MSRHAYMRVGAIAAVLGLLALVPWSQTCPAWTVEGQQPEAYLGIAVSAGDVNGDGYHDLIVGAGLFDDGETDEGRVTVYLGSPIGPSTNPSWSAEGDQAGAMFGTSAATAGDVNGDGYDDVIVGAFSFDNGESGEGRAFVYLGSPAGPSTSAHWIAESDQAIAGFGRSVAAAGDVNGDGYGDVIVGAPWFSNGELREGRAFVYLGSSTGLATSSAWSAESNQQDAFFGSSVATAGDVNGDGYDDVIVGAPFFQAGFGQTDEGRAYVFLGSATGLATSPAWTAETNEAGGYFGTSVATAGDVNGDGYDEVIVGAPDCCGTAGDEDPEGHVYVYLGSGSGLSTTVGWTQQGEECIFCHHHRLGYSVASASDLNGDGFDDVLLGAEGISTAYAYLGSAGGLASTPALAVTVGATVASAGDVDGDGTPDLIVGQEAFDHGQSNEGRATAFLSAVGLSTAHAGDGINADTITPLDVVIGSSWSAPLDLNHTHGAGGPLTLIVRSAPVNGANLTSPVGGRPAEFLVSGPLLGSFGGTHDGVTGDIPSQSIPNDTALLGTPWAAQYVVLGGGFADLSQAAFGIISAESCP